MSYEAIRAFEKIDKGVLDDIIDRLDRPGYRNAVVWAAEEAVKLLPKFLQAMEMLEGLADTLNDVPGHEGYEDLARDAGEFVYSESYHGYVCWEFEYAENLRKKAKRFDWAVVLLRRLRGVIHYELDPAKDNSYYVYDRAGIIELEIDPFLSGLEGE